MLDNLIAGATVVDGTGAPARRADVGVRDGRIVAIGSPGSVDEPARARDDAGGLVLAPGFVDPHTHYDAQLFWDPFATPSTSHGVTTVIGGNCGFTLAPLRAQDADWTRRMMARVEGMPLAALESGVPWTWEGFGDYLGALEGGLGVNAGFLVGHCALRRYVLGEAAAGEASDDQITAMVGLLHEALEVGGLGFSTTRSSTHSDGEGRPVPSRMAGRDELLALCGAVADHEGTTLEGIVEGCLNTFSDEEVELLTAMSVAAGRPLNWNVLTVDAAAPERVRRQVQASARTAAGGGRLVALTMPVLVPMNMSFLNHCALFLVPGWTEVMGLPPLQRAAVLSSPETRAYLLGAINSEGAGVFRRLGDFGRYVIGDTWSAANDGLKGRKVADIAAERGQAPFDALIDVVLADDLRTVLWPMPTDNDPATWELRRQVWDDPATLLGGSDAGAHLDRMCGAPYPTRFLGDMLRGRRLVPLERAVQMLTGEPAALFGLRDRGLVAEGYRADLVLFDPDRVGATDATLVADLPGGASRLTSDALGVERVVVNGVAVIVGGRLTGATPGTLLRSGRDTATVTVP